MLGESPMAHHFAAGFTNSLFLRRSDCFRMEKREIAIAVHIARFFGFTNDFPVAPSRFEPLHLES